MKNAQSFYLKTIAWTLGLIVGGLSLALGWLPVVEASTERVLQTYMKSRMGKIDSAVKGYHQQKHIFPLSLNQLDTNGLRFNVDNNGNVIDIWHHPILYSVKGNNYRIISLGRDGKPGGNGVDCDLSNDDLNPNDDTITFSEFLLNPMAINTCMICFLAGSIAGYRSWLALRAIESSQKKSLKLMLRLFYVGVSTLFVAYPLLLLTAALQRH